MPDASAPGSPAAGEPPTTPLPHALAEAALAQLAEGVIVADADGRIRFVNEAAARLHGTAALDVPVDRYAAVYRLFTEDGRPYEAAELPLARAVRTGETVTEARWRIRRPDGSEIVAVGSARPVRAPDGRQLGAVLTVRDDAARLAAGLAARERDAMAAQLRDAFDQSPVSTVVYDAAGHALAVNPAFTRLWGATLADVSPEYSVLEDPQLAAAGALVPLRRAFGLDGARSEQGAGEAVTLPALRYDVASTVGRGHTRWTQAQAYPVRGATGEVERVVLAHEDVTARLEAETALREAIAALEARNAQLEVQARELETANQQLQEAAGELEMQAEELQATTEALAVRTAAAEAGERRVRAAEERLRLALDSTGLGTWDYVPATDALHWDERTKRAFGLAPDAEVRAYSDFLGRLHPADRARTQALVDAAIHPAGSGEYDTLFRVVRPDGGPRWVRARGRALFAGEGAERRVARFIGTVLDVSAEREAAAERERLLVALEAERTRLAEVFLQAPVAVAVLRGRRADDLVFELVNPRYEEMIPAGRAPLGRTLRDALPEIAQAMGPVLQQVLDTGTPFVAHDYLVPLDRDGDGSPEHYYFSFVYHPLVEAGGAVAGIVGVGTEVTDSVRARREAERLWAAAESARAEAEAANRAKSEFLAVMSHELRTPLNAIDGYAELMELGIRGPLTAAQRDDLARIRTSQRHLLGLINGVLNYSRIEAGAVRYAVEPVPLGATLATCEALTAPQARTRGLALHLGGCDASLCARGDPEKVQQIVLNLLSNAVKFTEPGGRVDVACRADGERVVVTVVDTGRGIPADRLDQVFDPFVQVDASRTRTQEGVGLGLAISRDLARGMGGELTVESAVGVGSTFTLTLPRA